MTSKEQAAAAKNVDLSRVSEAPHIPVNKIRVFQKQSKKSRGKWTWSFIVDGEIEFDGHNDKDSFEEARKHAMKMCGTAWNVIIQKG